MGTLRRQRQRPCAKTPDIGKGTARPLRGATLALICERAGHGYELAARLNHRLGPAWQITADDIYPILNQLFSAGLVRREEAHRKTIYHAEPEAYEALERWQNSDVKKEALRSDVRARLATVPPGKVDRALRILEDYEADLLELIDETEDDVPPQVETWDALLARVTHDGTDTHLQAEFRWLVTTRRRFVEFGKQQA